MDFNKATETETQETEIKVVENGDLNRKGSIILASLLLAASSVLCVWDSGRHETRVLAPETTTTYISSEVTTDVTTTYISTTTSISTTIETTCTTTETEELIETEPEIIYVVEESPVEEVYIPETEAPVEEVYEEPNYEECDSVYLSDSDKYYLAVMLTHECSPRAGASHNAHSVAAMINRGGSIYSNISSACCPWWGWGHGSWCMDNGCFDGMDSSYAYEAIEYYCTHSGDYGWVTGWYASGDGITNIYY